MNPHEFDESHGLENDTSSTAGSNQMGGESDSADPGLQTFPLADKPPVPGAHIVEGAEPPLETTGAHEGHRHKTAAGLYAVYQTTRLGFKHMGIVRSLQTLLKVNQKDGFDCPSCAWPDPDGKRKTGRVLRERRQGRRVRGDHRRG